MSKKWPVIVILLPAALGAIFFFSRRPAHSPRPGTAETTEAHGQALSGEASPGSAMASAPEPRATSASLPEATGGDKSQVLARVNGVPILTNDLGAPSARPLTAEEKQALLEKAIDRELILQQAKARALALSAEQEQLLESMREGVRNSAAYKAANDPATLAQLQAEMDFQVRETRAQLLIPALVALPKEMEAATLVSQQQAVQDYLAGLRAGAKIER